MYGKLPTSLASPKTSEEQYYEGKDRRSRSASSTTMPLCNRCAKSDFLILPWQERQDLSAMSIVLHSWDLHSHSPSCTLCRFISEEVEFIRGLEHRVYTLRYDHCDDDCKNSSVTGCGLISSLPFQRTNNAQHIRQDVCPNQRLCRKDDGRSRNAKN
jgi:hypothetical protein